MNQLPTCPQCGAELFADAPAGLCPKCLVQAGFQSQGPAQPRPDSPTATSPASAGFTAPRAVELADKFPQLELLELLGQGGMGAVYKAKQRGLDRLVALKVLPPEISGEPTFSERFTREARALAKLSHQNIVPVYDFGQTDGLYFILMEYVDGTNLRQLMQTGELQPKEALAIIPQICEALQFAHDEGIVHRDIKPENILVDRHGRVKIADFGLAKLAAAKTKEFTITATHQVIGTPRYMAPEQMEGSHAVDHRADIYSLGVVFYEMLTGEVPVGHFEPPSRKIEIDVRLDDVVLRTLAREPERRYQQASDVKTDVESISSGGDAPQVWSRDPDRRRPARDASARGGRDWVTLTRQQVELDRLPDCCIVCGKSTIERKNKDFEHTPDWASMLAIAGIFAGLIPGLVVIALTTRKVRVACPICPQHRAQWRQLIWVASTGWLMAPALGLLGFGVAYAIAGDAMPAVIATTSVGVVIGLVLYIVQVVRLSQNTVGVEYITKNEIRLRGVSPAFARGATELAAASSPGSPAVTPRAVQPRGPADSTLARAWDGWWSERDRWFTNGVQIVIGIVFVLCFLLFFSFRFSSNTESQSDGLRRRQATVEFGLPSPWYRFETWPDETTAFQHRFHYLSPSVGIMLMGFLIWHIYWQIEKTKAKASGKSLRWWHGSPGLVVAVWGTMVLCAVALAMHPLYLDTADRLREPGGDVLEKEPDQQGEPSPEAQLLQAARRGDVSGAKRLLDAGVDVNDKGPNGNTALMEAAAGGHASLVTTLVLLGANVNERDTRGRTALMYAAEQGHAAVLAALQDLDAATNVHPPEKWQERIAQLAGIDRRLLTDHVPDLSSFRIDYHVQDESGQTAQMKAAARGNIDWFKALGHVRSNDDRRQDAEGRTMLMHAIGNNQLSFLRYLDGWYPPRFATPFIDEAPVLTDASGRTALELADELGYQEIAELMRAHIERQIESVTSLIATHDKKNLPDYLEYRARAWQALGDTEKATADLARAKEARAAARDSQANDTQTDARIP